MPACPLHAQVLSIPPSAAGCGRDWSIWQRVWGDTAPAEGVTKLAYVFVAPRAVSRRDAHAEEADWEELAAYLHKLQAFGGLAGGFGGGLGANEIGGVQGAPVPMV
jgi:hypothetical protein